MALVNDEPNRLAVDALDLGPGERVLELGFGPGWSLRTITARARGTRVYGVDQSARMIEQATRRNEVAVSSGRMVLVQGPFSPLPWIDEMFDKILLVNVLYFFDTDGRDIGEVYRVLRSGGRLVIYVTSRDTMQKWPFAGPDTHRTFDAQDLGNLLERVGFLPSDIKITNAELPLGIKGLLAIAEKSGRSMRRDKIPQSRARWRAIRSDVSNERARHGNQQSVGPWVDQNGNDVHKNSLAFAPVAQRASSHAASRPPSDVQRAKTHLRLATMRPTHSVLNFVLVKR